ncbi:MAG TPA: arginine N-succinyltransferase [Sphingobium sp.]|uniref:arginine N-succinyltransferase n=1 Tax=Sphingobium sp. TaxID=1912891 RepID=UPI002ED1BACC
MRWFVRPASINDLEAIYELAGQTGHGFTNLPYDRDGLAQRLERSDASFARALDAPDDELYIFVLQDSTSDRIGGTALIFSRIGVNKPFYSYKITRLSQFSHQLNRSVTTDVLNLVNDFTGATEVGGLFLLPELRRDGLGGLLSRSRYLFMALHRERFADLVLTELRGFQQPDGVSPFWNSLTRRFFNLEFQEADQFYALNGNQFIADLMPKYPIYTILLSEEAQAAIGKPHPAGVAAMKLLLAEGFRNENYVDLFDAGPTLYAETDKIRTVNEAQRSPVRIAPNEQGDQRFLLAAGRLHDFRAWQGTGQYDRETGVSLQPEDLALGRLNPGDAVLHVGLG